MLIGIFLGTLKFGSFGKVYKQEHTQRMSPLLKQYLNKDIVVVTTAGEVMHVVLDGYDKYTNLVVKEGDKIRLLRGSEIVVCGLLEDAKALEGLPMDSHVYKDTKNVIKDEYLIWEAVNKKHQSTHKKRKLK